MLQTMPKMARSSLTDERLSLKAKGLHYYMLMMRENDNLKRAEILKRCSDGETSLQSAIKELQKFGYVKIEAQRERGQITKWLTHVYEHSDFSHLMRTID